MNDPARSALIADLTRWYGANARDLPWRGPGIDPWAVMVSEFMLQQTPVNRVLPVFAAWLERWPRPADLAAEPAGEAVRAWGRLGYPRRALRLHASATAIVREHDGVVPSDPVALRALPGVGEYTAAAIAAFAYQQRIAVVDTNVRRVLHRAVHGAADAPPATARADFAVAESLLPDDAAAAATTSIALMELGALVCTSTNPACDACPIRTDCAWVLAGRPAYDGPPRKGQTYAGTDRQVRGLLLGVLRADPDPVPQDRLDVVWADPQQRARALGGLLEDGLVVRVGERYALPG